jgi:predicted DNA-binding transcriptional regulator YafY
MAERSTKSRLDRIEQLKGLLKDRDHVIATDLAEELGVSLRTLNRDLALLREQGLPLEGERGRGGGLRLDRSWAIGRLHLSVEEAIDLLVSLALAEKMNSPLLLRHLAGLRRKVAASFGTAHTERIKLLRRRVLVGAQASTTVISGYGTTSRAIATTINDAFFNLRCLTITYADRDGVRTTRQIEPQFLYCSAPIWYLLSFDLLRKDIRSFRIDRIISANIATQTFRPAKPEAYLAAAERSAGFV